MEIREDDVTQIMAIVSDCAQELFPDDIVKQAEHINTSYGSLLKVMNGEECHE